jgi:hypothetical protein
MQNYASTLCRGTNRRAAAFAVATGLAGVLSLMAAARPAAAQFGGNGPANPFENLKQATKEVSSAVRADPNARVDLRSSEIEGMLDRMHRLLVLTPYERTVLRQRLVARNEGVRRAIQAEGISEEARERRLDAIHRDTEMKVNELLTPDQRLKLKVHLGQSRTADTDAQRADKLHAINFRAAGLGTPREAVAQWGDALELNEAQRRALMPAVQAEFAALDAAASDRTLTEDEARWQAHEAMLALEQRVDALLTPEQKRRLESLINLLATSDAENPRAKKAAGAASAKTVR